MVMDRARSYRRGHVARQGRPCTGHEIRSEDLIIRRRHYRRPAICVKLSRASLQSRLIIRLCVVSSFRFLAVRIGTFYGYRNIGSDIPTTLLDSDMPHCRKRSCAPPDCA